MFLQLLNNKNFKLNKRRKKMIEGIIYKVTNTINGQVYIGATTQNLQERIRDHINKSNKDYNHKFQKAILEYGKDNFIWEEIDSASCLNDLALKETHYIEKFDSFKNGYNSNRGGGFKKIIYQFNLTGELISTFQTLAEASKTNEISRDSISHACLGDRCTSNGFVWNYTTTFRLKEDAKMQKVEQFSLSNELINTFDSITEAYKITGINKTSIAKCCRGERNKAGGFIWKTKN